MIPIEDLRTISNWIESGMIGPFAVARLMSVHMHSSGLCATCHEERKEEGSECVTKGCGNKAMTPDYSEFFPLEYVQRFGMDGYNEKMAEIAEIRLEEQAPSEYDD